MAEKAEKSFNVGDILKVGKNHHIGNLEHPFQGEVEKVYEHSVLLVINDNDPEDQIFVNEMNHRVIVSNDIVKIVKRAKKVDNKAKAKPVSEED